MCQMLKFVLAAFGLYSWFKEGKEKQLTIHVALQIEI